MIVSIQQKLAELTEEASDKGVAAVYAVAQLLHDCYASGTAKELAEHCCRFSAAKMTNGKIEAVDQSSPPSYLN